MLIDILEKNDYDFDSLPDQIKESIDFMTEIRESTQGTCDTKIGILDLALFNAIQETDSKSPLVALVKSKLEFDKKQNSNDNFNTMGLVDLSKADILKLIASDNIQDLSVQSESDRD